MTTLRETVQNTAIRMMRYTPIRDHVWCAMAIVIPNPTLVAVNVPHERNNMIAALSINLHCTRFFTVILYGDLQIAHPAACESTLRTIASRHARWATVLHRQAEMRGGESSKQMKQCDIFFDWYTVQM